jgi:8-oxo-dGTP pyrophosphatase MutT (NUDIX family)
MDNIRNTLNGYSALQLRTNETERNAAVALLLCQNILGPEILFVQRARHPKDPWSGNIGFPGGRIEETDASPLAAAIRETNEEIGLTLEHSQLIGQLDDLQATRVPIKVSCYVFIVDHSPQISANEEIEHAFWLPVAELQRQERHGVHKVDWHGCQLDVPSMYIDDSKPVLWGLTYRFTSQFLAIIDECRG